MILFLPLVSNFVTVLSLALSKKKEVGRFRSRTLIGLGKRWFLPHNRNRLFLFSLDIYFSVSVTRFPDGRRARLLLLSPKGFSWDFFSGAEAMVPPVEQNCDSSVAAAACGDAHRTLPTPFLTKTYQLVDDPSVDDVISWNDDGSAFVVWRPEEFARYVLPKYFKHNNFASFVRQLNTYGFRKIVPDRWEFANDCFRKDEKRMLSEIHRRKALLQTSVPANVSGSSASSGEEPIPSTSTGGEMAASVAFAYHRRGATAAELLEENENLRRENFHLRQEINQMKGLCNNIFALMTKYAKRTENRIASAIVGRPTEIPPEAPPDRREVKTEEEEEVREHGVEQEEEARSGDASPRLFGVSIRTRKRVREETNRNDPVSGTKCEPLDPASLSLWLRYCFQGSQSENRG